MQFLRIARTIINKYKRATKSRLESSEYFAELSTVPTREQLAIWEAEISEAEEQRTNRPEAMDIMAPRIPKGQFTLLIYLWDLTPSQHHHWLTRD
jgi:hypothetical protein